MIRYIEEHQVFILETKSTQYAMCVRPDGHLEHLYYGGRSLDCGDQNIVGLWDVAHDRSLFETGNAIALDGGLTLESLLQELSSTGKGGCQRTICLYDPCKWQYDLRLCVRIIRDKKRQG